MRQLVTVFFVATLLVGTDALAGARQHYQAGQDYYSQGRYKKAIEEFEEAYRLDDTKHLLLYNISQAYERLGDLQKTVVYLKLLLKRQPARQEVVASHDGAVRRLWTMPIPPYNVTEARLETFRRTSLCQHGIPYAQAARHLEQSHFPGEPDIPPMYDPA